MFIRALQSTHLNTLNYLTSHVLLNLKQHQQSNAGQVSFKERSEEWSVMASPLEQIKALHSRAPLQSHITNKEVTAKETEKEPT